MSAFHFRFNRPGAFGASAFRAGFAPRKPRHPFVRAMLGLVGLGLLAVLVFFSVFVGAAMLAVGLLYRLWSRRGRPVARDTDADANVVDGEYQVVDKPALPPARAGCD